ncbi:recombinase [Sinobacterium caligoides]|uniref:Recombinase n=1 Tax=Sinobacterium caligoides TaxID=933926 RepID=A0A3N2DGY7_9GAMM|nr:recombinase family protein [Sinobacterium caligoides]ROR99067.1 recombinase [Sinobacterium caligoides]
MHDNRYIYSYSTLCLRTVSSSGRTFLEQLQRESGYSRGQFNDETINKSNACHGHALILFCTAAETGSINPGSVLAIDNSSLLGHLLDIDSAFKALQKLIDLGVHIYCSDGSRYHRAAIEATNGGILFALSALLKIEKNKKNIRSKAKKKSIDSNIKNVLEGKTKNKPIGNIPSWISKKDGQFILNEKSAAILTATELYMEGYGCTSIAKKLNEKGIKSPRNTRWSASSIHKILGNSALYGEAKVHHASLDYSLADYYPALITKEQYSLIQHRLKTNKEKTTQTSNSYLFSGLKLLKCKHCNNYITLAAKGKNNRGRLCCRNRGQGHHSMSLPRSINVDNAEQAMFNFIKDIEPSGLLENNKNDKKKEIDEARRIIARLSSAISGGGDLETTRDQLKEYKKLLDKLLGENDEIHYKKYKIEKSISSLKKIQDSKNITLEDYREFLANGVEEVTLEWLDQDSAEMRIMLLSSKQNVIKISL